MLRFLMVVAVSLMLTAEVGAQRRITITPVVTASDTVLTPDSVRLVMTWLSRAGNDAAEAPVAMLLPMMGHDRTSWHGLDSTLARHGFKVVSVDMRGHGASTTRAGHPYRWQDFSNEDFARMPGDVGTILEHARAVAGDSQKKTRLDTLIANADFKRVALIGASIGSSAALLYAADHPEIVTLILLSPGLNYRGLETEPAMKKYGNRPVYLAAGRDDSGPAAAVEKLYNLLKADPPDSRRFSITDNSAHGTDLFTAAPTVEREVTQFLVGKFHLEQEDK